MGSEDYRNIPFFRDISEDVSGLFLPLLTEVRAGAGERIFEEGSVSDKFFVIKEGEVEIRKIVDRHKGTHKLIAVLSKGEFFGEMSVFLGQPRSAEAVAKTDATLITVSKDDLALLFRRDPEGAFKIMEFLTSVLMDRLRNTTKELATVYETGKLIASARGLTELADFTMEGLFNSIGSAEEGLFAVWNDFNDDFEAFGLFRLDLKPGSTIPKDNALIRRFLESKESFLSFDLREEKRLSGETGIFGDALSMVASPLFSKERLLGFIVLLNRTRANAFSYNHMVLLSALSGYVTVALENMRFMQDEIDRGRLNQAKSSIY
jgi:CRP-like cAMP-binding protein